MSPGRLAPGWDATSPMSPFPAFLAAPPDPGPGGGRGGQLLHHCAHSDRRPLRGRPAESDAQRLLLRYSRGQVRRLWGLVRGRGLVGRLTDNLYLVPFAFPQWSRLHCRLQSEGRGRGLALGFAGESGYSLGSQPHSC